MNGAPVDLSFKNISKLTDALMEEPKSSLRPLKRNAEGKYISCSLRLSNNSITDLCDLQKTVSHFLAEPSHLAWLDLSFNQISHIDQALCKMHELRVLYLHGNNIYSLSELDRLGALPHLHSITLQGNPVETNKTYRNRVISALPQLKTVDFSAVTQQERVLAKLWHQGNSRSKRSEKRV
ncbi:leucine-rich repeat-containing protein 51 isoform X2 [Nothobranchius furzeri]|uniref:Leucine-rich repeat-containing protein 51 n=2 Tax=Nothobranchius furzeri TaxID=105023 RepID=A0A8C6KM45_NOTFU|nr:leucine rich repeat containing 51 isoform X2 [Nothobranchius furzeri]KAF7219098.1 transcript variant X2 [Nothobranchius furzeri]